MSKKYFRFRDRSYRAMLFDMDGTLIDNMLVHHEAWRVALAKHGIQMTLEQVKAEIHGVNHEILLRLFGDKFSNEQAKNFANDKEAAYRRIYADKIELIEGVQSFLECAKRNEIPMAVATAAPVENVNFVFEKLPIAHYFQVVKHAGDVSRGKPDPQVFVLAATGLALDVKDCLVFEDSVTGALAAQNAGADSVIITTTHREDEFAGIEGIVAFAINYADLDIEVG